MPKFMREELADGIVCYLGDCRDVLTTLPDESVHCCVTSPPYWGLRDYGTAKWEGGDPECDHKSPRANKVFGNPVFNKNRPSRALTETPSFRDMPESVRDRCTKAHEYIFLLSKSQRYYYDADAIAERASNVSGFARERRDGKNTWNYGRDGYNKTRIGGMSGKETFENSETRNKRSVWEIATQPFSEAHFATFPSALIEPCILAGCPKDGTVLDPFGGAGTTGLVCINHARKFIGIELNHKYMDMACKRMIKAVAVPNLFVRKPKIHAKFRQQSFFRKS